MALSLVDLDDLTLRHHLDCLIDNFTRHKQVAVLRNIFIETVVLLVANSRNLMAKYVLEMPGAPTLDFTTRRAISVMNSGRSASA